MGLVRNNNNTMAMGKMVIVAVVLILDVGLLVVMI